MNTTPLIGMDSVTIHYCTFKSTPVKPFSLPDSNLLLSEEAIQENLIFTYPVIVPKSEKATTGCIVLLHGLNEASWDKYLTWASSMAVQTGKSVVLFPMAFHINRAPEWWRNPRSNKPLMDKRKSVSVNNGDLSFANVALSERLSQDPSRFFLSGRQTVTDLVHLVRCIKSGMHPLFNRRATVDFFAYSIGSFLAEVLLMANPFRLFDASRLFIFCGGSIFKNMYGVSRYIMDKEAYQRLFSFYCQEWLDKTEPLTLRDKQEDSLLKAFNAMILPDVHLSDRLAFFKRKWGQIAGIALSKDSVMPYSGVEACMGVEMASACFQRMDFPFDYSHESPFPSTAHVKESLLKDSFTSVFKRAAAFLA